MSFLHRYKTFDEILPDFLGERKIMLKPRSYAGDISRFKHFRIWLTEQGLINIPLKKITNQDISRYFVYLAGRLDKPTSQKYFVSLRMLWQYSQKIKEVGIDLPFDMVVFPKKKGDFSPQLIPKEKYDDLMADIRANDFQLYVACMTVYYCFIRPRIELRLLKTEDVNMEAGFIRITDEHAKTGFLRYATITPELKEAFIEYGINEAPKGLYVFGKKRKIGVRHIGINSFSERFNVYRNRHGISKGVKFYSNKHTGMTDMLNSGVPLPVVQGQAGHLRLSSTQHYVKKYSNIINSILKDYIKK